MKKIFLTLFILSTALAYGNIKEFNSYFINASAIVKPSVVNLISYEKNSNRLTKKSYGTGTIISRNGYIVTNYHVVKNGSYFKAVTSDGKSYDMKTFSNGKFYVSDYKTDIAILKIDNSDGSIFSPIKFGDSDLLEEGEWVIAIGNPYGLRQSITAGIVSSKGRNNLGFTDIEDFIQTDVSINPGNSGGPLINLKGEMMGINTAIRSGTGGYQGISFAIPSNIVAQVCHELIEYGRVRRGWLGLIAREREFISGSEKKIVEIISVIRNSPSDIAGIVQGDIIKEIDGVKIDSLGSLTKMIGNKKTGSRIQITLSRNGKIIDINLTLREKDEYEKIQNEIYNLFQIYGIEVDEDSASGKIVVTYVSPSSPFKYLEQGDIIISINYKKIETLEDFILYFIKANRKIDVIEVRKDSGIYEIRRSNSGSNYE
ncbi:MAG: Periplasmic serine endoprotease DegP precursor [Spirochaetes bacterium ADurb.Bin218]|jgi:S1-C subfamily serine protease|nr:trypsin-like peptidase domain-containing protein [Spirochaetota bacterium]OQA96275.1 MAG: Periplasmic serine endoprotease DegP precursor [Spirochaetes bacterium ADurb.Bin218]HOQ11024.1 trypsin-like peptidase domain-containing protein [Spirochaetota bacterium]